MYMIKIIMDSIKVWTLKDPMLILNRSLFINHILIIIIIMMFMLNKLNLYILIGIIDNKIIRKSNK